MAKKIEIQINFFVATDTVSGEIISRLPTKNITWDIYNGLLHIVYINRYDQNYNLQVADLVDVNGDAFASQEKLEDFLNKLGGQVQIDANLQDQTTDTVILPLAQTLGTTTLAVEAVIESYDVTVTSSAGMTIGNHFRIINTEGDRYYSGTILDINANVITLDSLVDFAYLVTSEVTYSNINMAVDGSVTPIHFHLRTGSPSIPSSVDITRMIIVAECDNSVDLNKFGDLAELERGILFRISNGHQRNIFNVKKNLGLTGIAYDWTPYDASHPTQAVNGFSCRLSFGGQSKIGVVLRVEHDGQLGMIIQDDLTDLITLSCVLEGHVVSD